MREIIDFVESQASRDEESFQQCSRAVANRLAELAINSKMVLASIVMAESQLRETPWKAWGHSLDI